MALKVLDKVYDPKKVENKWYQFWMDHRLFEADNQTDKPTYTIVIPPPNVTGMLTMGHILNNTIQDLLVRWKGMDGYESLWLPGTDHAGIATQNKVEAALKEEGFTRHDLGREKLVERVWEWKEKYGGIILKQLRKLGSSCDWSRERFTMDEGLSDAVKEVFIQLYEKGLIYRGRRLINWCPRCHTALADEEAPNKDTQGKFWHIAYPIENSERVIIVSTTRPETMLGDTAVAVHPEDERYQDLIGKNIVLPLMNRIIPVVADEHADPEKGSGAVKITPAHDFDDFEVGQRHHLPQIQIMDDNGFLNENAGGYKGLERFEARKKILADLDELGLLKGDEPRQTPIPHCYRCDTVVEPHLSDQWFVKMEPLAKPAIEAVRDGRIHFHPKQWEETYFHWMENIRDWCISRQIWWGHRIPVWTCSQGHTIVVREVPIICPECGDTNLTQDPDVLDTWFSSWLWPFSTLGWPEETDDLKAFFPTDSLVTGPDIIFFWVARMIMASLEFMGEVPFKDVYFNGMIRDLKGRKMSKSLGNSPDPQWLIEGIDGGEIKEFAKENPSYKKGIPPYGADAIRLSMVYVTPLGGDIHFDHTLVELGQRFCNKLWNASRFVLMNLDEEDVVPTREDIKQLDLDLADQWILSRLQKVTQTVRHNLDQFRCNDATHALYHFIWGEFCDWYLELIKIRLYAKDNPEGRKTAQKVVMYVLEQFLELLHPIMPFITEEIWQALPRAVSENTVQTIMHASYPVVDSDLLNDTVDQQMELLQKTIGAIRNIRGEMNVPQDKKANVLIRGPESKLTMLETHAHYLKTLGDVEELTIAQDLEKPQDAATGIAGDIEIFMPLAGLIDLDKERERITKEIERLKGFLVGLNKKLNNQQFVERAPEEVIEKERQKQRDAREKMSKLEESLNVLG